MPYAMTVSLEARLIEVVFTGSVTIPERSDAFRAVVKAHSEHGYNKVLADFSQATAKIESDREMRAYANQLAQSWILKLFFIAYVGNQERTAGVESAAALRGYFFQRFVSREAALSWLA